MHRPSSDRKQRIPEAEFCSLSQEIAVAAFAKGGDFDVRYP
jgi:hypothetical protein